MKKCTQNMKAVNRIKKNKGKARATISVKNDCHWEHSKEVRSRMEQRRSRNYSHFVETLIAEDTGLIPKLQEAAA